MITLKKITLCMMVTCLSITTVLPEDQPEPKTQKAFFYTGIAALCAGLGYALYRIFKKPRVPWSAHAVKKKRPLCRTLMDEYRSYSPQRIAQLRDFWKSPDFSIHFKSDDVVQQYVEIAYHLYRYAKEKRRGVCSIGQSFAYVILIVQFFKLLNGENPDNCFNIALSNDMENIIYGDNNTMRYVPPDDNNLRIYYEYLKSIGFISNQQRSVIICDQVESGRTIIEWDTIFKEMKKFLQGDEKLPHYTYYVHHAPLRTLPSNISPFDFSFSVFDNPRDLIYPFECAWSSLVKAKGELRLIPSYGPQDWHKIDPFTEPETEARTLALRFLDYIVKNGLHHVLDFETVQRSLYFHEA